MATSGMLRRYSMAKPTLERETHFRKNHSKTEDHSKFFNLVRKNRKFKKGKMSVLRGKNR